MTNIPRHISAFRGEIAKLFDLSQGKIFYDLTLGDGGHTQEALEAHCRVVSVDIDPEAIKRAVSFVPFTPVFVEIESQKIPSDFQWLIINDSFVNIHKWMDKLHLPKADALIADLGPSQFQILSPERGFSFDADTPLDMRLTSNLGVTAANLVNALNEGELAQLFSLADEPFALPVSRAIVRSRERSPILTAKNLSDLISRVKGGRIGKIHPATQIFMALRMAVNLEREAIRDLLPQLPSLMNPGGVLGIISFHSGEDRLVKSFFKEAERENKIRAITQKPLTPPQSELKISQRTRSAKLRLAKII